MKERIDNSVLSAISISEESNDKRKFISFTVDEGMYYYFTISKNDRTANKNRDVDWSV